MSFFNIFKLKIDSKAYRKKAYEIVSTDYIKVINSIEIGSIDSPPFEQSHYNSEQEYKQYLESIQPLIDEYEKTGNIHSIEYDPKADIEQFIKEQQRLQNFKSSFLDCANWINAEKTTDSKYIVCTNGRHRMYVAKKYGFRLIIHVCQEQHKT